MKITLKKCEELIEFIDDEMSAFNAVHSEDYDYERALFVKELSKKVFQLLEQK